MESRFSIHCFPALYPRPWNIEAAVKPWWCVPRFRTCTNANPDNRGLRIRYRDSLARGYAVDHVMHPHAIFTGFYQEQEKQCVTEVEFMSLKNINMNQLHSQLGFT